MLALTRRLGEAITIGPNIRVVVIQVKGGTVRLGIEAPRTVEVHRDEVYKRILEQNRQAVATSTAHSAEFSPGKSKTKSAVQVLVRGGDASTIQTGKRMR